ncbi:MAG: hypothetical protein DGJ47_000478 [Rickettsiaceae bacterium]
MSFINKLWIKLFYQKEGADQFGNVYYTSSDKNYLGKEKRFVYYNGIDESSKVPPMWHAWLHYLSDELPNDEPLEHSWQKEHTPNLTGTKYAYLPKENSHDSHYSSWLPNQIKK